MKTLFPTLAALCLALCAGCQSSDIPTYLDKSKSPGQRAEDLVSRLTLEEKVGQMMYQAPAIERLGIPSYNWWNEALHGVGRNGDATMFPMPIAMAASFDEPLLREVFSCVSDEARIKYRIAREDGEGSGWYEGLTYWTPNINIFRDPRWGRGMETYGEDPYLMSIMGGAVVDGLQEDGKTLACAKHMAVHSGPEWARHRFDIDVAQRDLYETYLPAFKYLVTQKNVAQVMFAYNSFRGVPCGVSQELLVDILQNEWRFKGLVVSDCGAVDDIYAQWGHRYIEDKAHTAVECVRKGVDLECGSAFSSLLEAVEQGLIEESELNEAVVSLFAQRYALGDIDNESRAPADSVLCCKAHHELSLNMAREGMVLLKNDGILPLSDGEKLALVGPNGDDIELMWGNYNGLPAHTVTLLEALRNRIPDIKYVWGCPLVGGDFALKEVLDSLEGVETIIFAGGISPRVEGEEMPVALPGFRGGDRTTIELPEVQREFVAELCKAGKKVIFVNFSGGAVALRPESEHCSAMLQAWYPGQEGGTAIADVLFGTYNPSGRLPVTFYACDAQLPQYENYDIAGRTYRYFAGEALYPFGYGLSYTTFEYGTPVVRGKKLTVEVRNIGSRDGSEVVQFYLSRPDDPSGPRLSLRGFQKVSIPYGESRKVSFTLDKQTFEWWSEASGAMQPLRGKWLLSVGSSSEDIQTLEYKY